MALFTESITSSSQVGVCKLKISRNVSKAFLTPQHKSTFQNICMNQIYFKQFIFCHMRNYLRVNQYLSLMRVVAWCLSIKSWPEYIDIYLNTGKYKRLIEL